MSTATLLETAAAALPSREDETRDKMVLVDLLIDARLDETDPMILDAIDTQLRELSSPERKLVSGPQIQQALRSILDTAVAPV